MIFLNFVVLLLNFLLTGFLFTKLMQLNGVLKDIFYCCDDISVRLSKVKQITDVTDALVRDVLMHIKTKKKVAESLEEAKANNTFEQKKRGRPKKNDL